MIALHHTRAQLLAEIGAPEEFPAPPVGDPLDPAFLALENARLVVRGHCREDLLPALESALQKRVATVSRADRVADLLYLLKKGLGNAFKRGNRSDPGKWITAEVVVTREGALLSVSDEGAGFDVERTVQTLRQNGRYWEHGGSGLSHFERSSALVSYAAGGRTLLLRFLFHPEPGAPGDAGEDRVLAIARDPAIMRSLLGPDAAPPGNVEATRAWCRAGAGLLDHRDHPEIRYVLQYAGPEGSEPRTVVLTGRALPAAEAALDFSATRQLHGGAFAAANGIGIPSPIALLEDPPLVLFRFDPSRTLREYADGIRSSQGVAGMVSSIASGLIAIHRSGIELEPGPSREGVLERRRELGDRVEATLRRGDPPQAERARRCFDRLLDRAGRLAAWEDVPVHGALSWDSIVYEGNRPYFCHFERACRSHPGFDVGGFLADLMRFYLLREKGEPEFHPVGRQAFLDAYFAGAGARWQEEVGWFVADALLLRLERTLGRSEEKWKPKVTPLLDACEEALR